MASTYPRVHTLPFKSLESLFHSMVFLYYEYSLFSDEMSMFFIVNIKTNILYIEEQKYFIFMFRVVIRYRKFSTEFKILPFCCLWGSDWDSPLERERLMFTACHWNLSRKYDNIRSRLLFLVIIDWYFAYYTLCISL